MSGSRNRMRILVITPVLPLPADKGVKVRMLNLLKLYSRKHLLHLLAVVREKEQLKYVPLLKPYCEVVETFVMDRKGFCLNCLAGLVTGRMLQSSYVYSSRLMRRIRAIVAANNFDLIHIHLLRMAQYGLGLNKSPKILDLGDAVSEYIRSTLRVRKNILVRSLLAFDWFNTKKFESKVTEKFSRCLMVSEVDAMALGNHCPAASLSIIPNGADINYFRPTEPSQDPNTLIFVGNFTYYPNVDAALYFSKRIFPRIRKQNPQASLHLVGASPPRRIQRLGREPGVIAKGYVDDIRPYLSRASVFVNPVRIGAGTSLKLIEAMAMGKASVSTTIGCQGLSVTPGRDILVADNPDEFASTTLLLMKDDDLRERIGLAARRLTVQSYDWERIGEQLGRVMQEIGHSAPPRTIS